MHEERGGKTGVDKAYTEKTYKNLNQALGQGFKFGEDAGPDPAVRLMQQNLFRFSAAKSVTVKAEMNRALYDDKGNVRDWAAFKAEVDKIDVKYNANYLQAEWQTARQSGHAARNWQKYESQKHLFPNLKYKTAGDDRVRKQHAKMDGVVAPVDDKFWDRYYPPNGWRCRCYVIQTTEAVSANIPVSVDEVKPEFEVNVGKKLQVFQEQPPGGAKKTDKQAPYFTVAALKGATKEIDNLDAKRSRTEVRQWAKKNLKDKTFGLPQGGKITITSHDVHSITGKPHNNRVERDGLLYDFDGTLKKSKYLFSVPETKGREQYVEWDYYQYGDGDFYLNVAKMKDGSRKLHAITDIKPKKNEG